MFDKKHKHNPHAPIGLLLGKLAISLAGALLKRKIEERRAGKDRSQNGDQQRNDGRSTRSV